MARPSGDIGWCSPTASSCSRSSRQPLLIVFGATVNALVPLYAIGVFTGFAIAGFGMARYHKRVREQGWRRRRVINVVGGIYTALVVVIFAVVKFSGAPGSS